LEHATSLGYLKRAFFAAHWLLIDEGERDDGQPGTADYDGLNQGKPPGRDGATPFSHPTPRPPQSGFGNGVNPQRDWPSTTARPPTTLLSRSTPSSFGAAPTAAHPNGPSPPSGSHSDPSPAPPRADTPYERIKDRYHAPDGQQYPLLIRGILTHPITMTKKADAIYYDGATHRWHEIGDEDTRLALARAVEAGQLKVSPDWQTLL
jgi:hypothetical protein